MLTANSLSVNKLGTTNFKISPQRLFTDGSNGFWLDASDQSTLFQDSAGDTPVTALGDPVGLWLDKHESDGRGIVNKLLYTNEYRNAESGGYWSNTRCTITAGIDGYDGALEAFRLTNTDTTGGVVNRNVNVTGNHTWQWKVRAGTATWCVVRTATSAPSIPTTEQ